MRGSALGFSGFVGITSFCVHRKTPILGCSVWLYCVIFTILREIDLHFARMRASAIAIFVADRPVSRDLAARTAENIKPQPRGGLRGPLQHESSDLGPFLPSVLLAIVFRSLIFGGRLRVPQFLARLP